MICFSENWIKTVRVLFWYYQSVWCQHSKMLMSTTEFTIPSRTIRVGVAVCRMNVCHHSIFTMIDGITSQRFEFEGCNFLWGFLMIIYFKNEPMVKFRSGPLLRLFSEVQPRAPRAHVEKRLTCEMRKSTVLGIRKDAKRVEHDWLLTCWYCKSIPRQFIALAFWFIYLVLAFFTIILSFHTFVRFLLTAWYVNAKKTHFSSFGSHYCFRNIHDRIYVALIRTRVILSVQS